MSRRVFDHARLWQMTPAGFAAATTLLAEAAAGFGPISEVIAVTQGGSAPAAAVAAALGVPVRAVRARHNATNAAYTHATGVVECTTEIPPGSVRGQVLIVDDICGTGATLDAVRAVLAPLALLGTRIRAATLCRNAGAAAEPDLWVWDVTDWVVFPWEQTPPIGHLSPLPLPTGACTR